MIKIFLVFAIMCMAIDCECAEKPQPKCGKRLAFCGRGATTECCEGLYCNIAPNDAFAYCDLRANPTCGKQGDICGGIKKVCCKNYICNTSRPDSHPFCDLVMRIR